MKTSWIIGLVMLAVIMQILCSVATLNASPISSSGGGITSTTLNNLISVSGMDFSNPLTVVYSVATKAWEYFTYIINLLFWNYPVLFPDGTAWQLFRVLLMCVSAGITFSIISIMRGVSSQ